MPGCVEKRKIRLRHVCEYDGKLSVVVFRERLMLYARSNLGAEGGARHVQVTSMRGGRWTPFRQIAVEGVLRGRAWNNMYYMNVQKYNSTMLLGFTTGILHLGDRVESGAFVTKSFDGIHWSTPILLYNGTSEDLHRTNVHVGGVVNRNNVLLLKNVLNLYNRPYKPLHRATPQLVQVRLFDHFE